MSDLHEALQSIDGVGDATADKILEVFDQHAMDSVEEGVGEICGKATDGGFCTYPATDCPDHDTGGSDPLLEKAIDAAHEGDDRDAAMYLRRYDSAE